MEGTVEPAPGPGATATPDTESVDGDPGMVTLMVKAPNQSVHDHRVVCHHSWTVAALKEHLHRHYPDHPRREDQKLIYAGRLLPDDVVLKDILRHYEGQNSHTFHLVCSIPQRKPEPSTAGSNDSRRPQTTDDGLRQRNVEPTRPIDSTTNPEPDRTPGYPFAQPYYWDNNHINTWSNLAYQWANRGNYQMNATPPVTAPLNVDSDILSAQLAWMQQLQAQYVQLYSEWMQNSDIPPGQFPTNNQFTDTGTQAPVPQNANNNREVANNNQNFQNDLDNWDWLDWFHMMSKVMLMFAVVYFYSSPSRFLLVVSAGYMLYLYQIGYFNNFFNRENNPADNMNNNNQNNNQNLPRPGNDEPAENLPEAAADANGEVNLVPNDVPEQPSFWALSWTIISSFLTSILPENPNAI